jgi:Na+-driven multidrug efflux pump
MPVLNAISNGFSMIFRAIQQPNLEVITYSLAAPLVAVATVVLTTKFGLAGTAWSMVAGSFSIALAAGSVYFCRHFSGQHEPEGEPKDLSSLELETSTDLFE